MQENEQQGVALIGAGVRFTGTIQARQRVEVHGTVEGDVQTGLLIIGAQGVLHGKTTAQDMRVSGVLNDMVVCKGVLQITASGTVRGQVTYGAVAIERGGRLLGSARTRAE